MTSNRGNLIILVGTVGSGKSTQIRLLDNFFKKTGRKTKTVTLKTNHIFAYILSLVLRGTSIDSTRKNFVIGTLIDSKPSVFRKMLRLWLTLDAISVLLRFIYDVKLPLLRNKIVFVEEYLPAILTDYYYICNALNAPKNVTVPVSYFLYSILSSTKPDCTIFLDADSKILHNRWKNRGTPHEKMNYIKTQRNTLYKYSRVFGGSTFLYINTSFKNANETRNLIINFIDSKCTLNYGK